VVVRVITSRVTESADLARAIRTLREVFGPGVAVIRDWIHPDDHHGQDQADDDKKTA
jgi:hypothetical protein